MTKWSLQHLSCPRTTMFVMKLLQSQVKGSIVGISHNCLHLGMYSNNKRKGKCVFVARIMLRAQKNLHDHIQCVSDDLEGDCQADWHHFIIKGRVTPVKTEKQCGERGQNRMQRLRSSQSTSIIGSWRRKKTRCLQWHCDQNCYSDLVFQVYVYLFLYVPFIA